MTEPTTSSPDDVSIRDEDDVGTLAAKLTDALTPGFVVEFDPTEAVLAGAFVEDALSEHEAAESQIDLANATALTMSGSPEH
ncbi:MAG: hypothetical protein ACHQX3_11840 [Nitrospirales bacterium]